MLTFLTLIIMFFEQVFLHFSKTDADSIGLESQFLTICQIMLHSDYELSYLINLFFFFTLSLKNGYLVQN